MKNTTRLLNLLSAFMAVIGACAAALVCFIVIYTGINGEFSPNTHNSSAQTNIIVQTDSSMNDSTSTISEPDFDTAFSDMEINSESSLFETKTSVKPVKSGTYTIDAIEFWFSDSVINDITGRWRISSIASSKDITEYITDYYNALFSSDDEIHAIVNFSLNTTTSISVLPDGTLDVAVHEYIDGEEHDAKALFGGMLLKEYFVNPQTGGFEEISVSSSSPLIDQNESNIIYSYEIPVDNSSQVANISSSSGNADNFNTYDSPEQQQTTDIFVLNTSTLKIHYPNCNDVLKIALENYSTTNLSINELKLQGYTTCGHCF